MRWAVLFCLAAILVGIAGSPVAGAQPATEYEKNLQIHLVYKDSRYSVSALEVRYGTAPHLAIRTGDLKGAILDAQGRELRSFTLEEPGVAYGDILGQTEEAGLTGYTERPAAGDMYITLPYLQDMQTFTLSDARDGSLLVSADLRPAVAVFCTGYPKDPDCLRPGAPATTTGAPAGIPGIVIAGAALGLLLLAVLSSYVLARPRSKAAPRAQHTILVVDDEPAIVDLVAALLKEQGYAVLSASGGRECLEIIRNLQVLPDAILLDIMMEPMDGWQALKLIKSDKRTKEIPVLMLTGKQLTAAEAKEYNICIEDYIMKPFTKAELDAAIKSILHRKKNVLSALELARKAGIPRDTYCEFAKLSRHVVVNRKIIGLLQQTYGVLDPERPAGTEADAVIGQLVISTRNDENRLEQLRRQISSAFMAKGYPVPRL